MVVRVLELNFPSKCGIIHSERGNEKNGAKARAFRKAVWQTDSHSRERQEERTDCMAM